MCFVWTSSVTYTGAIPMPTKRTDLDSGTETRLRSRTSYQSTYVRGLVAQSNLVGLNPRHFFCSICAILVARARGLEDLWLHGGIDQHDNPPEEICFRVRS